MWQSLHDIQLSCMWGHGMISSFELINNDSLLGRLTDWQVSQIVPMAPYLATYILLICDKTICYCLFLQAKLDWWLYPVLDLTFAHSCELAQDIAHTLTLLIWFTGLMFIHAITLWTDCIWSLPPDLHWDSECIDFAIIDVVIIDSDITKQ